MDDKQAAKASVLSVYLLMIVLEMEHFLRLTAGLSNRLLFYYWVCIIHSFN